MSYQQEQVREWAYAFGAFHPDREWLNSPLDSWEKNPHYTGPKGRHPEDDYDEDEVSGIVIIVSPPPGPAIHDDDIPF